MVGVGCWVLNNQRSLSTSLLLTEINNNNISVVGVGDTDHALSPIPIFLY